MTEFPNAAPVMPSLATDSATSLMPTPPTITGGQTIRTDMVLKEGAIFLVADTNGDITPRGYELGLYAHDTRMLNRFVLRVGGALLAVATHTQPGPTVVSSRTHAAGSRVCGNGIEAHRTTVIDDGMYVHLTLRNTSENARRVPLSLGMAADFRDMFDVRGLYRGVRGTLFPPIIDGPLVRFHYDAQDGVPLWTEVRASLLPTKVSCIPASAAHDTPGVRWRFMLDIPPGSSAAITFSVRIRRDADIGAVSVPALLHTARVQAHDWTRSISTITTDHDDLNRILRRSAQDLRALLLPMAGSELPVAGIPWFVAPFGRDACVTALESLMLTPHFAVGTLRVLARTQGTKVDPTRDEQPGKIVHEIREGELARLGLVPHAAYYGSVDSTPLFVMLFAAAMRWLDDDALYRDLLPAVRRAIAWCDAYGDLDGDGYVEFERHAAHGTLNQGWKDSDDSMHRPNGSNVTRPIALVEVQGYVYAAKAWLAEVVAARGETAWAAQLHAEATTLAAHIEHDFWLPEEGTYAYALDAEKRPVRTVVSNAGHLLFTGVSRGEHAAALTTRLLKPDMRSGWGIRTLSTEMQRYNPDSYHNGSIWPHDNTLIAMGMRACGQPEAATIIASEVLEAGMVQPLQRLPELYAGYPRTPTTTVPVPYPVSCAPQAWAAASAFAFLHAMLGLTVDGYTGAITCAAHLPPWLNRVDICNMRYGQGRTADIHVRHDDAGSYTTEVHAT